MAETVYSGQAMQFLEGYATDAYKEAKDYIQDLYTNFVAQNIDMVAPKIEVDTPSSVNLDPALVSNIPQGDFSNWPAIPAAPSSFVDYAMPTAPQFSFPNAPTLTDIAIPDFIEGSIASITTSIPTMGFDVPAVNDISTIAVPLDSLMQAIQLRLIGMVENGGTMLNPQVEADIWDRDLERNEQALQDQVKKAADQWAKMGFSLPDGLLSGNLAAINNEYMNRRIDRSREIAVKQAELEQQGIFKALEHGVSVENIVMTSQNEYAKRVLDAAKYTADITIEIFKNRVVQYNALLDTYKTDVEAYKASIQAETERVDAYKARLSALQTIVAIDESRVKVYTANLGAIEQMVNVYNTEVKAVATMYDAEKTKIEAYGEQVRAYVSTIEGITKKYLTQVEGFKAYVQAYSASADTQTKLTDIKARADIATVQATVQEWEIQLKTVMESIQVKLEALKTVSTVSSNLAAGALSAIHASVSDSFSNAISQIHSYEE